ncbi:hypothetical protein M527_12780 [Sphingobium indicum IP26]|nr:hypothetical protein M527_29055 [Sphingobium indicum IP26]EPR18362.1 hypothetical protein M527_12780 [Sphingobium indicum IP26]EQB03650.1 hypothetical protein L286_11530 [Sphingobium sp. HDIP04]
MLSGIGTIIGALAVIYAAHKGSDTFKQWRRQKNEERRIELAEQVLTLAYKLRRAIEGIRSPAMWGAEQNEVYDELRKNGVIDDQTPEGHKGILATAQATISRSNAQKALWDALLDTMPTAKAVFGDEVENALNEIWKQRSRIITAAQRYARFIHQTTPHTEEAREKQFKKQDEIEAVIWFGGDADGVDAVANSINGAIKSLEDTLLLIIRSDTPFGISKNGID